jgi:hypothetical protein
VAFGRKFLKLLQDLLAKCRAPTTKFLVLFYSRSLALIRRYFSLWSIAIGKNVDNHETILHYDYRTSTIPVGFFLCLLSDDIA